MEQSSIDMLEDSGGYLFQKLVEKIRMTSCGDEIWPGAIAKFVNMKMLHVLGLGLLKNVCPTNTGFFVKAGTVSQKTALLWVGCSAVPPTCS